MFVREGYHIGILAYSYANSQILSTLQIAQTITEMCQGNPKCDEPGCFMCRPSGVVRDLRGLIRVLLNVWIFLAFRAWWIAQLMLNEQLTLNRKHLFLGVFNTFLFAEHLCIFMCWLKMCVLLLFSCFNCCTFLYLHVLSEFACMCIVKLMKMLYLFVNILLFACVFLASYHIIIWVHRNSKQQQCNDPIN